MYEVVNNYNKLIDLTKLEDFVKYCVKELNINNDIFSVVIIDNESIKEINNKYRNKNTETDCISFAFNDNKDISLPVNVLGDIYISYDKVLEQAKLYEHSIDREICFLFIHGLLHLLGYDHIEKDDEEVMFERQELILNAYGLKRNAKEKDGI